MQEVPVNQIQYIDVLKAMDSLTDYDWLHFKEMHMLRLPSWLCAIIHEQAIKDDKTFEDFIREACMHYVVQRILDRNHEAVVRMKARNEQR